MARREKFKRLLSNIHNLGDMLGAVVVHLNDTYLLDERPERGLPGFARLAATVDELRSHVKRVTGEDRVIVVHSGDFLGPSRLSNVDKGMAMVEAMNRSGVSFAMLGNHEFDHTERDLRRALKKARFRLVLGNVNPPKGIRAERVALWPNVTDPVVALTSVVSQSVHGSFGESWGFENPSGAMARFENETRHVPWRIALTHADQLDDFWLRVPVQDSSRFIMLGGHDHDIRWGDNVTIGLYKNLANLATVRVFLLALGGATPTGQLFAGHERHMTRSTRRPLWKEGDEFVESTWDIPRPDVRVFQRWLSGELNACSLHHVNLGMLTNREDELLPDATIRRMVGLPFHRDCASFTLDHWQFAPAKTADTRWAKSRLRKIHGRSGDSRLIKEFPAGALRIDARDRVLRRGPSAFGTWVAECVLREADADVAILNSGSFRADAILPLRLRQGDLAELFLFDRKPAPGKKKRGKASVIVIEMPSAHINALINHGKTKSGAGAYAQVAKKERGSSASAKVAIASYILLRKESIDGYIEALIAVTKETPEQARARIEAEIIEELSIVDAVRNQALSIKYNAVANSSGKNDLSTFVELVQEVREAFERADGKKMTNDETADVAFCRVISGDSPHHAREVTLTRNALRGFLREIAKRHPLKRGDLRSDVKDMASKIGDGLDYQRFLEAAATDIKIDIGPRRLRS